MASPLYAITAESIERLRRQSDMGHHRHAARSKEAYRLGYAFAAFELDCRTAGLRDHASGIAKGLLKTFLIGAERHVDDHQRPFQAPPDRLSVHDHHLERDAKRRRQAVKHHADTVTHQDDIAVRIDQLCNGRCISG